MKIIPIDQVEKRKSRWREQLAPGTTTPGKPDDAPVYSYRVFTLEPGGNTPYHSHPYEHMNFVIERSGGLNK